MAERMERLRKLSILCRFDSGSSPTIESVICPSGSGISSQSQAFGSGLRSSAARLPCLSGGRGTGGTRRSIAK